MRIVVTGGGTAGHISPILAVVDALKRQAKAAGMPLELLYIGTATGMEVAMARQAGIPFAGIKAGKYRRIPQASILAKLIDVRNSALNVRDLGRTVAGVTASLRLLNRFKPDVVFAKGGFVGLPVAVAARILGIPVVIHESDVVPGLGNKIVSRWAKAVAVGFPVKVYKTSGQPSLPPSKLTFTGNPVRPQIAAQPIAAARRHWGFNSKRPVVLAMGGSQGAQEINDLILEALPELLTAVQLIHITGEGELSRIANHAAAHGLTATPGYIAKPFLDAPDMALALSAAEVVVSRAGANTIAELAALAKPTILIPNRLMAAHQLVNAKRLEKAAAVRVLSEENLTGALLCQTIIQLLQDETARAKLSREIAKINVPDAADRISKLILLAANPPKGGGR